MNLMCTHLWRSSFSRKVVKTAIISMLLMCSRSPDHSQITTVFHFHNFASMEVCSLWYFTRSSLDDCSRTLLKKKHGGLCRNREKSVKLSPWVDKFCRVLWDIPIGSTTKRLHWHSRSYLLSSNECRGEFDSPVHPVERNSWCNPLENQW